MFHTVERLKTQQYGAPTGISRASQVRIEYEGRIASSVDALIVSTEHEREQLRRLYGLCCQSLRIVPCGVDLETFTPGTAEQRATARRRLSPDGLPVLLFVGRLDAIKDIDLLLASVATMRTPARLYVVGGNPDGDPEVERLRDLARDLGIAERVVFNGAAPQRDLPEYYRAADAVVVSSRYESFGLVAVEALACGTPVVASAVGGLPSIVRDGENGQLVRWRRPEEFAARLDALVTDARLRERLASHARDSVERFAWGRIGDDVRALYSELTVPERREVACSCF
jgi:D-inositol-3-phosphate glycosyltransferase